MSRNTFEDCAAPLSETDILNFEKQLGATLPAAFKQHYLKFNGGKAKNTYWIDAANNEPMEISYFKSISAPKESNPVSVLSSYESMVKKNVIPKRLLPFATDLGGNFFCIDLETGAVVFFATDSFDPEISLEDNQKHAEQKLCPSFEKFIADLISEDDIDEY